MCRQSRILFPYPTSGRFLRPNASPHLWQPDGNRPYYTMLARFYGSSLLPLPISLRLHLEHPCVEPLRTYKLVVGARLC